jgi:hypothetical protein
MTINLTALNLVTATADYERQIRTLARKAEIAAFVKWQLEATIAEVKQWRAA